VFEDTTFWFFSSSFSTSFSSFLCLLQLQPDKVKRLMTVSNGKLSVWVFHHFPQCNKCYLLKVMLWNTLFWYEFALELIYVWGDMYKYEYSSCLVEQQWIFSLINVVTKILNISSGMWGKLSVTPWFLSVFYLKRLLYQCH